MLGMLGREQGQCAYEMDIMWDFVDLKIFGVTWISKIWGSALDELCTTLTNPSDAMVVTMISFIYANSS